jgi:pyruvate dehydrogenase E2 component (dihydrolipoamide acetyltransferase)
MNIVMPKLGLTMTEGTITRWLKAEGDVVQQGEILFEFESEKSALEFESPANGVLAQILARVGETVPCDTPIAILETHSTYPTTQLTTQLTTHPTNQLTTHPTNQLTTHPTNHPPPSTPAAKRRARELGIDLYTVTGRGPQGRIHVADVEVAASHLATGEKGLIAEEVPQTATPVAKRLASEAGLDWRQIPGSGPGGRVVKEDVLRTVQPTTQPTTQLPNHPTTQPPNHPTTQPPNHPTNYPTIPLSGIRGVIARRMSESAFTAPHVTLFTEADATALVEARAQLNAELVSSGSQGEEIKISYDTLLVAIVARVLREHPRLNACLIEEEIRMYNDVHIALAVDTGHGLLVPVIRYADRLDVVSIQRTSDELIQRALDGKSLPDDLVGGTFTLTNLGIYEIDGFTPIINQPQAAILGIGRITPRAVAVGNEVAVRQMMTLSLSFDHRIVDGGPAARFLQRVKGLVERPFALVIPV